LKVFSVQISCNAPFPTETSHLIKRSTLRAALGVAMDEHIKYLKDRKRYRKRDKNFLIRVQES